MKPLSRRKFLELCAASATTLGLSQSLLPGLVEALTGALQKKPTVLWLQGAACSGCSISLLNSVHPDLKNILSEIINLQHHPQLGGINGTAAIEHLRKTAEQTKGKFLLVVEGAVPTAKQGRYCIVVVDAQGKDITFQALINELAGQAALIMAVGTCSSYGGVPAAKPNLTECKGLNSLVDSQKVVNVPGCPPHPDWMVGTLAQLLMYGRPEVDAFGRPKMFYGGVVHDNCPRRQFFDNSTFALTFGEPGCLLEVGCKGPMTFADCSLRQWNGGANWCIRAGSPCINCTHPEFPEVSLPLYGRMDSISFAGIKVKADTVGKIAGTATALGIGAHLAANLITKRVGLGKTNSPKGGDSVDKTGASSN
jgi:hydrogenase small subunit